MWTAFLLASLVAGGVTAYGMWTAEAVAAGASIWPFVAGLPCAFLVLPLLFTILWFVVAGIFGVPRPADARLTLAGWIGMFCHEWWALTRSIARMILFRRLMPAPAAAPAALPVVLLHGIGCNAGVWAGYRRHLALRGNHSVYALSYGPPLHSIELFADQLDALIARIEAATGAAQLILIGHSMGGLVARAYLRRYGAHKVRRLVTIGTPHHGSMHAWLMTGTSLSQLRPGNAWLAELNRRTSAPSVAAVSVWSWHDSMVSPPTSSRIDWGENIVLAGIAHNALLDHPDVWAAVDAQIDRAATSGSPA